MKEIESQLAPIISKAIEAAEKTGDFVIEQAPLVLQEFYAWYTMKFILSIIFTFLGVVLFGLITRWIWKQDSDDGGHYIVGFFIGIVPAITLLGIMISSIYDLIFITTAPRLYLIEYFAGKL